MNRIRALPILLLLASGCAPITATIKHVESMDSQLGEMRTSIGALPRVETALTGMNGSLGDVVANLKRLENLEREIGALNEQLSALPIMGENVAGMRKEMGERLSELSLMRTELATTNERIRELAPMPKDVADMNHRLALLDTHVLELNEKMRSLQSVGTIADGAISFKWALAALAGIAFLLHGLMQMRLQRALLALAKEKREAPNPERARRRAADEPQGYVGRVSTSLRAARESVKEAVAMVADAAIEATQPIQLEAAPVFKKRD